MDEKPVIIIGGGLWGTLLALRIRECLPQIAVRIYEPGNQLGEKLAVSFHASDVSTEDLKWLTPFISRQWDNFEVSFPRYRRNSQHRLCTMEPAHFHSVALQKLGANTVFFNHEITPEEALREGTFVIDTVARGYFKALAYQKIQEMVVELKHPHRLLSPLTMDASVEQKNGFRYFQALPLTEKKILVKDVRFSSDPQLYHVDLEQEILEEMKLRRWIPEVIMESESEFWKIPRIKDENFSEGRVIRLDGFIHDVTGDALPDAVRLIERMVKTSFRLGELKLMMKDYLLERRARRKLLRFMNRMLFQVKTPCHERYLFFQSLHSMSPVIREKFYKGDMELIDILKLILSMGVFHTKYKTMNGWRLFRQRTELQRTELLSS